MSVRTMRLNDDFTIRAAVHAAKIPWIASPAPGVERKMLFRIGDEVARATSIVRFAPGSRFPRHVHGGGEEILVLEGVFQDEAGDYPAGSYLRNPPGTAHAPFSDAGCILFVKLWQFRQDDDESVAIRPGETDAPSTPLYRGLSEKVWIQSWPPEAELAASNAEGLELLVLSGAFTEGDEFFEPLSWLRLPPAQPFVAKAGPKGVRLWLKAGPLLQPGVCDLPA